MFEWKYGGSWRGEGSCYKNNLIMHHFDVPYFHRPLLVTLDMGIVKTQEIIGD